MSDPYWPLFDLVVRTPRLEIRPVTDELARALVALASEGIHDPDTMPFTVPWTDEPSPWRERHSLQHYWGRRAEWTPERWHLSGAVLVEGAVVGAQDLMAEHFGLVRTVSTGSWLGRAHQGRGLGTEMRAAILHLAFAGLGAVEAYSGAFADNAASRAVSASLGYEENGRHLVRRREAAGRTVALRLTRERWEARRRRDIELVGLGPCLELFGVPG